MDKFFLEIQVLQPASYFIYAVTKCGTVLRCRYNLCFHCVPVDFLCVLQFPPTLQRRANYCWWVIDSKLSLDMNASDYLWPVHSLCFLKCNRDTDYADI